MDRKVAMFLNREADKITLSSPATSRPPGFTRDAQRACFFLGHYASSPGHKSSDNADNVGRIEGEHSVGTHSPLQPEDSYRRADDLSICSRLRRNSKVQPVVKTVWQIYRDCLKNLTIFRAA